MAQRRILEGLRVIDFTRVVAGPYCTRMLADMGAEVVKIDEPLPAAPTGPVRSSGSIANNLGKRSISLDLKSAEGVEVARSLAARADVLVENFVPGAMDRLGLGQAALAEANPRLVYASISGFGHGNSSSDRRAFGATAHAEAGWLWVQQQALGGDTPFAPGVTVADLATGQNAFAAILAALYDRERTGRGQHVDVSLMDSQLGMLGEVATQPLNGGAEEEWAPFRHPIHETADGRHVTVNIGGRHNWARIAAALGHEDEPMPSALPEANATVGRWIGALTAEAVATGMDAEGAPYGLVLSMREAVAHPHFVERGMIAETEDVIAGSYRAVGSPLFFSDTASEPRAGAPLAGQHTREVLRDDLEYPPERIEQLLASGGVMEQATG